MPAFVTFFDAVAAAGSRLIGLWPRGGTDRAGPRLGDRLGPVLHRLGLGRYWVPHAVDEVDEPIVVIAGLAVAFGDLGAEDGAARPDTLLGTIQIVGGRTRGDADDLLILGRWLVAECGGPEPAVTRLSRRLRRLGGAAHADALTTMLKAATPDKSPTARQRAALDEISRALRLV